MLQVRTLVMVVILYIRSIKLKKHLKLLLPIHWYIYEVVFDFFIHNRRPSVYYEKTIKD